MSWSTVFAGPKHSSSVPFSAWVAVPLSVDVKEELFDPNPVSDLAVKALPGPQTEEGVVLCGRGHSLPPFTLQMVTPRLSPLTVHLNINVLSGQARGAAVNCPVTPPNVRTQCHSEVFP